MAHGMYKRLLRYSIATVTGFVFGWLPLTIVISIQLVTPARINKLGETLYFICFTLAYLNTLIDPVIYYHFF